MDGWIACARRNLDKIPTNKNLIQSDHVCAASVCVYATFSIHVAKTNINDGEETKKTRLHRWDLQISIVIVAFITGSDAAIAFSKQLLLHECVRDTLTF